MRGGFLSPGLRHARCKHRRNVLPQVIGLTPSFALVTAQHALCNRREKTTQKTLKATGTTHLKPKFETHGTPSPHVLGARHPAPREVIVWHEGPCAAVVCHLSLYHIVAQKEARLSPESALHGNESRHKCLHFTARASVAER